VSWFKKFFEKEDWRMCGTLEVPIVRTSLRDEKETGTLYYFLYENQFSDRRFDVADTFRGDMDLSEVAKTDIVYRSEEYMTKVKPWLGGRKVTGVTSYTKAPMHDFRNKLENGE